MQAPWLDSLRDVPEIGASSVALLGSLVSGPPLAPFGLIRQVRRALFGQSTLYLEAMLADSDLVESVSKDGVELVQEFRVVSHRALRERVLGGQIPATELRAANHCERHPLSPLLALEEQLVWAYISLRDPAPECDRLLSDCLLSIVREERHLILDWAAGALHRLPDLVLATQGAWLLSELCNALHRETRKVAPPPMEQIEPGLLQEVLPLLPSALVGFHRDGTTLSLGPPNRRRRTAFAVPGIALRPVTVTWTEPGSAGLPDGADIAPGYDNDGHPQNRHHEVTVDAAGLVDLIPVGKSAVRLRTASGAVISLGAFGADDIAPELVEVNKSLDLLEDAWRNARSVTAVVLRIVSPQGAIVRFVDAWALSGHVRLDRSYLENAGIKYSQLVGREIDVRVSSFERQNQRIMCRPASPAPWSPGILAPGLEVDGRFKNAVNFGFFVEVPTTEQGFDGPTIAGLVHNSTLPPWWLDRAKTFRRGDALELRVLTVDQELKRISLEISNANAPFPPEGTVLAGRVVNVVYFGAFIELSPGVIALLHNSEIPAEHDIHIEEIFPVQVISVDYERGRISVAMEPRLPEGAPSRQPPNTRTEIGESTADATLGKEIPAELSAAREAVAEFIRQELPSDGTWISGARLSTLVKQRFGSQIKTGWLGFYKFTNMVKALVPEAHTATERFRLEAGGASGNRPPQASEARRPSPSATVPSRQQSQSLPTEQEEAAAADVHDDEIPAVQDAQLGAAVAAYVRQQLRQFQSPILVSALEKTVAARFGPLVYHDRLGRKRFELMLATLVPEARMSEAEIYPL